MKKILVILGFICFSVWNPLSAQESFYQNLIAVPAETYFSNLPDWAATATDEFPYESGRAILTEQRKDTLLDHFIDWTTLHYFFSSRKTMHFTTQDDFVFDPSLYEDEESKILRPQIYQDLLSIIIDNGLTVKRLSFLNSDFRTFLFQRLYMENFIEGTVSFSQMRLFCLFSFTGDGGLIDLFIKSRFYNKEESLAPIDDGPYIPNAHKSLVIEARGMNLSPALFPNIYTRDKVGKLKLLYSFRMANKSKIVQNGYVHYVTDEKPFVRDSKNFYTSALGVYGESQTDVIISRQSYLQFFSSAESLKNLREGNFYIVVDRQGKKENTPSQS